MKSSSLSTQIQLSGFFKPVPISSILLKIFLTLFLFVNICNCVTAQQKTLGMVKHLSGSTENGYVLFTPMSSKSTFLIDKCGKLVHQWNSQHLPGLSVYLLPDGNLLRTGLVQDTFYVNSGKGGIIEKIDWSGKVLWRYKISNDSLAQHHDIYPMANGNILVIAWHGISESSAESLGRLKGTIAGSKLWSERILELKPKGLDDADIVWQWSLVDHLIQDESISKPDFNIINAHPELMNINYAPDQSSDWIHLNSIDYNADLDQILLSAHNTSEIWIIDHSTTTAEASSHWGGKRGKGGDLLYRWGNSAAYSKGAKTNQKLFYQHNANWIPKGYKDGGDIMIFNNGLSRVPAYSSVEIVTPPVNSLGVYKSNRPYGPSNSKWTYKASNPTDFFSPVVSGANRLRNGNTLICNGVPGEFWEIDNNNTVVWKYINPVSAIIMTDGESGSGNSVFRCTYYSDSFAGFNGKNLTPSDPIELKSFTYSCSIIPEDVTSPKTNTFLPANKSTNIAVNPVISITFDEKVLKANDGFISVYENSLLKETIPISASRIIINGKKVTLLLINNFAFNSHISIAVDYGSFQDSSGNLTAAIDSSNWSFQTAVQVGISDIGAAKLGGIYPNPTKKSIFIPYENSIPKVEIMNHIGQFMSFEVKQKSYRELEVDLNELANGIYSIHLNGQFSQIIIKK